MYIVLILLLIIALGAVYYLGYVKNNEEISELLVKIDNINAQVSILKKNNTKTDNSIDNSESIYELTPEITVKKIAKASNNRYLITADYNIPIEITEEEYEELVETGNCEKYLGFSGTYNKQSKNYPKAEGYGYVVLEKQDSSRTDEYQPEYEIVKTNAGYGFIFPAGPGWPLCKTVTQIEFYMQESDTIYIENDGEKTLKEYEETIQGKDITGVTVEFRNDKISLFESAK